MKMIKNLIMLRKDDMDIFNSFGFKNSNMKVNDAKWILLKNILTFAMMFLFGYIQYFIASNISNKSYMLIIFYIATFFITIIFGIVRSQSLLFSAKDNSLLLSLPIKKHTIMLSRIILYLISQYGLCLLVMVPAIVVYIMLETPVITFYINSLLSVLMLPIIPSLLGGLIGYFIQIVSSNRKKRNMFQTVLTISTIVGVAAFMMNVGEITENLNIVAKTLEEFLLKLYYPLGVMYKGIDKFVLLETFITLMINIGAIILFTIILGFGFFRIIRNLMTDSVRKRANKIKCKKRGIRFTLFRKELKRYMASPILILNTMLTPGIILLLLIYIGVTGVSTIANALNADVYTLNNLMLILWVPFSIMMFAASATTPFSISLEGKKNWINRCIPVDTMDIFLAKIITSMTIMNPIMIINTIIVVQAFNIPIYIGVLYIITLFIANLFISLLGLVINLMVPNMDYINEVSAIKQSKSAFSTTVIVAIFGMLFNWIYSKVGSENILILLIGTIVIFGILNFLIWKVLKNQGKYRYEKI